MNTGYRPSLDVACKLTRRTLAELKEAGNDGLHDPGDDRLERDPHYWVGRLAGRLRCLLLSAEQDGPATVAECDEIIVAASAAKSRLIADARPPLPAPEGLCGVRHPGSGVACHRQDSHPGGHRNWAEGICWPRADATPELDAAVSPPAPESLSDAERDEATTPPGHQLPAAVAGWDEPLPATAVPAPYVCQRCGERPPVHFIETGAFCEPCVDRCHEATEFDHICAICAEVPAGTDAR